ncbi:tetratricopeptide repeat protein [Telmatospirillum siberiense]|uniref:Sulfotransferase n=1 Tax=Telmatospirillum siberiense TaxID=382514 RepID=A0A2N3PN48_9PROT|nr:tetratricopeptide repeat-containing glycosyltransferase family protein [Telmatospirillum siberiense]PKU21829.1 sulfotransferase [Telmatospirillum siberiense]
MKMFRSSPPANLFASAMQYHRAGQMADAERLYRQILDSDPYNADALHCLGIVAYQAGQNDVAVDRIRKAIAINSTAQKYYCNLGNALQKQNRMAEAIKCYQRAVTLKPDYAVGHYNIGRMFQGLGQLNEAISAYKQALMHVQNDVDTYYNLGNAFRDQGNFDEAVSCYERVITLKPDYAEGYNNLAAVFQEHDKLDNAIICSERAILLKPDLPEAHNNRGYILQELGCLEESLECYHMAIHSNTDYAPAHRNLGIALLLKGDFTSGWKELEWRDSGSIFDREKSKYKFPRWKGESLHNRSILLYDGEDGFGDTLQFARYISIIADLGARTVVLVDRSLAALLGTIRGVDQVIGVGDEIPECDFHLPLMSAPFVLGTRLDTVPSLVPYISADPAKVSIWERKLAHLPGLKVGLVWGGNPRPHDPDAATMDRRRSLHWAQMAPLLRVSGVSFISLQKGTPASQLQHVPPESRPVDYMAEITNFSDTAALVENLDLVITVDTSVAHLAGALNKPVWILSRFNGCWRWLLDRENSPWYPSARLFRQPKSGDWQSVIENVCIELEQLANTAR